MSFNARLEGPTKPIDVRDPEDPEGEEKDEEKDSYELIGNRMGKPRR